MSTFGPGSPLSYPEMQGCESLHIFAHCIGFYPLVAWLHSHGHEHFVRNLALVATLSTMMTVSLIAPFFPGYAKENLDAPETVIGLIVACNPFAQVMSTPLWSFLSTKISRSDRLSLGLSILAIGTIMFAYSNQVTTFMIARALQGIGSQGSNSAALALVIERDLGLIEFIVGVGYMIGPAVGGISYRYFGFQIAVMLPAVICVLIACAVKLSFQHRETLIRSASNEYLIVPQEEEGEGEIRSTANVGEGCSQVSAGGGSESQPGDTIVDKDALWQSWKRLTNPPVLCICFGIVAHAAAQGFKELALARHLKIALGADSSTAGMVFMIEPIMYSIFSFVFGKHSSENKVKEVRRVIVGLFLYGIGVYLLATPDIFALSLQNLEGLGAGGGSGAKSAAAGPLGDFVPIQLTVFSEWILDICSLLLMGIGSAAILVPSVPYMLSVTLHFWPPEHDSESDLAILDQRATEDSLSGLYSAIWSIGELMGPPLGHLFSSPLTCSNSAHRRISPSVSSP
ncbi:hypothetical protein GUITHDRAFT_99681 [Guillardia theta CCMP2712]|uniref:Major facilitator superfamily (MFS) profile domain-containing protein n=1 Tax=Guillardia theta (strain CCMP2712) TaxID=905079 RepID=L1K2H8_GUITC|nr:hypothetical protein GUITHDRAFT_99681 [Guillardia theta CCMP2712]EKX55041.1 hypothetical protein GUITHDRAFT_99681 [Guillardia theta CCMP2712]|eukprot:XP_005842021.1 hypothetical protein GUITHDRAFT_99681 [Guillardia theta CCMP2712]